MRLWALSLLVMMPLMVKAEADPVRLAVASNFKLPLQQLVAAYQAEHGGQFSISSASTGVLYQQIRRGAPFDIFFAADTQRPALLLQQGYARDTRHYAQGQLALYSAQRPIAEVLNVLPGDCRLAYANPKFAPYGIAAQNILADMPRLQACKAIIAANVSQAFQFTALKNTDVGLVAYSLVLAQKTPKTAYQLLPRQQALVQSLALLGEQPNPAAEQFIQFLTTPIAKQILRQTGYEQVDDYAQ
ncbi:molybdate ABC transporter substrate-binding protein [Pseudoalteromonas sp. BDTF-M6]|uniref:molybdate ABC transporter substrate-binding protein n=1 Tax=Pseudoalteromonas sp. BDTF-M6 TaxID=2796132 RepID=UPI001BAF7004|nr:molybdate ABC transporter substrate-binding protein [Pseudoalteromonas sp. BDTF-M6]MBS3798025.1 molybdate ABC transporter substrate-binding protein [Pseudoalteromonas sp. BDTF-M6]